MGNKFFEKPLTLNEAKKVFFDWALNRVGTELTCLAYNSEFLYYSDTSTFETYESYVNGTGFLSHLVRRKTAMYLDMLPAILGRAPNDQVFLFDVSAGLVEQGITDDYSTLRKIIADAKTTDYEANALGLLTHEYDDTFRTIAMFSFGLRADAMQFKLEYC